MSDYLVGKVLKGIKLAEDKQALLFIHDDDNQCIVRVDGDCCSESWVEAIEAPALGFPCTVSKVEDLQMKEEEWKDDYELIQFLRVQNINR